MSSRFLFAIMLAACAGAGAPALAQYDYPPGYAGWNGWGASTAAGSTAQGMGAFAAGAGSYNVNTAQARSVNADTAMKMNDYVYQNQQRRNQQYYAKLARERKQVDENLETTYTRLHDNPQPADVHRGDALNVIYDELIAPLVYVQSVSAANQPITGMMVKNIPFQYAAGAITISLEDLSAQGVPDVLLTDPGLETERQNLRAAVTQARKEESEQQQITPETLAKVRVAVKAAQEKVSVRLAQGTPERAASDNWLKALYGLTKMLQTPNVGNYLKELKADSTTTLGQLLTFMHSFNLRFGAADTPVEQANYDQLYPMLVQLRNQLNPPAQHPTTSTPKAPDSGAATSFFSGMDMSQVTSQPGPPGSGPQGAQPPGRR